MKKIDIGNGRTPVAAQHGIRRIPHLLLYDPQGQLLSSGLDGPLKEFRQLE